ncbi:thioredoxin family protein [Allomuricauda sp. F6463D]|uniref:thioredoxin family protein n=1 Tax=Allomuricauda sp. F6463D TaxID=2926409 RepID=UPI001FF19177|nr:thioredoxin fold domain-containing protein [Muricauda sp. F6463D]MCK0159156.1 thioredoxin family protein [Muricauda sp. F6463D]
MKGIKFLSLVILITTSIGLSAQTTRIEWLSFEQLEDSLAKKPKKVFVSFYTDWCVYCKKMEKVAYKDPEIIAQLNSEYYAVKMDAETTETIVFDGQKFENKEYGKKRNAVHEIPLLLASREGRPFSLPAIVLLDESFRVTQRHFEYLSPKKMLKLLKY